MRNSDRKAAIATFKERKSACGIYAVRCSASGEAWVGQSLNLGAVQNRLWFSLRHGEARNPALLKAWRDHGAESFTLEILERLSEEELSYGRDALLKERMVRWRSKLGAAAI